MNNFMSFFLTMPIVSHAESIKHLQELIRTKTGGIIFATIQKFGKRKAEEYPILTDRKNIICLLYTSPSPRDS